MTLEQLRNDILFQQKKGLPFIYASVMIWLMITIVTTLNLPIMTQNILVFCCSAPLMLFASIAAKFLKVDLFHSNNPLSKLAMLLTMNQMLYLLIVMWVFNAEPDKMVMVYAMVFGAHLLPYSWVYKSATYQVFAVIIPVLSLILGNFLNVTAVAGACLIIELVFVFILHKELKAFGDSQKVSA